MHMHTFSWTSQCNLQPSVGARLACRSASARRYSHLGLRGRRLLGDRARADRAAGAQRAEAHAEKRQRPLAGRPRKTLSAWEYGGIWATERIRNCLDLRLIGEKAGDFVRKVEKSLSSRPGRGFTLESRGEP